MEESRDSAHNEEEKTENPFLAFFTNLLSAIKLPFPQKKNGAESEPAVAFSQADEPILVEDATDTPNIVTVPRQDSAPITLAVRADEAETNPLVLWHVYAIGGILVLRWAWMRWNERKGKKKSEDEPPPPRD